MSRVPSRWFRRLDGWGLFIFSMGTCFLHGEGQQRLLGICLILSHGFLFLVVPRTSFQRLRPVPREIWLYTLWVVWTVLTGLVVAVGVGVFLNAVKVLLQMLVMVWVTYSILRQLQSVKSVVLGIISGVMVQLGLTLLGFGNVPISEAAASETRVLGSTNNPNTLGFMMVWGALCALLFWYGSSRGRLVRRAMIIAFVTGATTVLLATGSRKSAIALAVLIYFWLIYARGGIQRAKKVVSTMVLGALVLLGILRFGPALLEHTMMGHRFEEFSKQGGGDLRVAIESNNRYRMYVTGLKLFVEHPIFGVGLDNFRMYYPTGQYSHSNFIEPLATTGLVGFLLFQSFYFLLMWRAWRLLKIVKDPGTCYRLRMILVGIVAMMVIGVGAPQYTMQIVFLLLTAFSVEISRIQRYRRVGIMPSIAPRIRGGAVRRNPAD